MSQMEKSLSTEPIVFETNSFISCDGGGIAFTLKARDYKDPQCVLIIDDQMQEDDAPIVLENHPNDSRVKIREDNTFQALTGRMGTGGVISL